MKRRKIVERVKEKDIGGKSKLLIKLAIWFLISLTISVIFFPHFWASLGTMLSPSWIFGQHHAAPWGVLGLCGLWLGLKRKQIWREMETRENLIFLPLGLAAVVGAILMPPSEDFVVFQVLLATLGIFIILFGRGARIPAILLGIYGFAISFPLAVERFAELPYSISALKPLVWILTKLGYAFQNEGELIHFSSYSGEPVSVAITAACAGPVTMGVFLAIFALMMLDTPLPWRKAIWLFLFGAVGTWFQSFIRLVILMLIGYQWGREALWIAHSWTIYLIFPLWYLLFAYIYFEQAEQLPQIKVRTGDIPVTES